MLMTDRAPHVGAVAVPAAAQASGIAALGWLHTRAGSERAHLALPNDLFMVSLYDGGDDPDPGARPCEATLSVTLMRTRAERFRSRAQGRLLFALLTPMGLLSMLRAPLDGRVDQRLDLSAFCRPDERRGLRDEVLAASAPEVRSLRLARWLEARIQQRQGFGGPQARVAQAATSLLAQPGPADLQGLRQQAGVSQRQLERDFRRWLGVSLTGYARLVRFQQAAMAVASGQRLVDAATDHHYADQAHLNRSFRELASVTPREFAAAAARPRRVLERGALAGRVVVVDAPARGGA